MGGGGGTRAGPEAQETPASVPPVPLVTCSGGKRDQGQGREEGLGPLSQDL